MSFHVRHLSEPRKKPRISWGKLVGIGLTLAGPVAALVRRIRERHERELRMKRWITVGMALIVALSILVLTASLLMRIGALSFPQLLTRAGAELPKDKNGATNILLLGQGNEEHDGIDLTDTIIVASLGPSCFDRACPEQGRGAQHDNLSAVLLSLPRDLYFLHTEHLSLGKGKLNALWRDERIALGHQGMERAEASMKALQGVAAEIGAALGMEIHEVVKVDFTAFEDIVNLMGGIDLTVPETINDTEFPGPNYSFETFHLEAGLQHMDGATALKYARTRHTSSDFDRSARQQEILRVAAAKAKESGLLRNPKKLVEIFETLREHVETTLQAREMITLASVLLELPHDRIITLQLNDRNGLYGEPIHPGGMLYAPPRDLFDGAAVLLPVSIPEFPVTFKQVQTLGKLLFGKRELFLKKPKIAIFNGGAKPGSARTLATELTRYGFTVENIGNADQRDLSSSLVSSSAEDKDRGQFFGNLLGMQAAVSDAAVSPNIAISLGKDYRYQPLQDLMPPPHL